MLWVFIISKEVLIKHKNVWEHFPRFPKEFVYFIYLILKYLFFLFGGGYRIQGFTGRPEGSTNFLRCPGFLAPVALGSFAEFRQQRFHSDGSMIFHRFLDISSLASPEKSSRVRYR